MKRFSSSNGGHLQSALVFFAFAIGGLPGLAVGQQWCWQRDPENLFLFPGTADGSRVWIRTVEDVNAGAASGIYIAGHFDYAGSEYSPGIARFNGASWESMGGFGLGDPVYGDPVFVDSITGIGDRLLVRGQFTAAGFELADGVAAWDGMSWAAYDETNASWIDNFSRIGFGYFASEGVVYCMATELWLDGVPTHSQAGLFRLVEGRWEDESMRLPSLPTGLEVDLEAIYVKEHVIDGMPTLVAAFRQGQTVQNVATWIATRRTGDQNWEWAHTQLRGITIRDYYLSPSGPFIWNLHVASQTRSGLPDRIYFTGGNGNYGSLAWVEPATKQSGLLLYHNTSTQFETITGMHIPNDGDQESIYIASSLRDSFERPGLWRWDGSGWNKVSPSLYRASAAGVFSNPFSGYGGVLVSMWGEEDQLGLPGDGLARFGPSTCPSDMNRDCISDNGDIITFVSLFLASDIAADLNGDGILDNGDIVAFITLFLEGC